MSPATTRRIIGPVELSPGVGHNGSLRLRLLYPLVEGEIYVQPSTESYAITDGELPVDCLAAVPGRYELQILDLVDKKLWGFKVNIVANGLAPITVADLFVLSNMQDPIDSIDLEGVNATVLSSGDAPLDALFAADGEGGTYWRPSITHGTVQEVTGAFYNVTIETHILAAGAVDTVIQLPASESSENRIVSVKKITSNPIVVTITPDGTDTIEGLLEYQIQIQHEAITLLCTGTSWFIF